MGKNQRLLWVKKENKVRFVLAVCSLFFLHELNILKKMRCSLIPEVFSSFKRGEERFWEEGETAKKDRKEGERKQKNRETGEPA